MAAPSFSLGLDLDSDDDRQQQEGEEEDLDLFEETLEPAPPRPPLKRLKRGPPPPPPPPPPPAAAVTDGVEEEEEEIEDFSSQETADIIITPSLQSVPTCSSTKVSLHSRGILSSQSNKLKTPKASSTNYASASSFDASSNKNSFPMLNVSPLRKIHLLDSDSDDDHSLRKGNIKIQEVDATDKRKASQSQKHQNAFWKDFIPKKSNNLATPALDEFCEEYFGSMKDRNVSQHREDGRRFCSSKAFDPDFEDFLHESSSSRNSNHSWNYSYPQPPAYRYFFHEDARVMNLIRERFPYFVPIGAENHRETQHLGVDNIDYMGQFGHGDVPSQARGTQNKGSERTSKTKGKRPSTTPSTTSFEGVSEVTGSWVHPRSNATIPKDAGKRRVSAVNRQSGHWFTGQDGRKVYISKNGQELAGRIAYRQYRKETGGGPRKGKKKASTKKKKK